jgi:hypothetical protein
LALTTHSISFAIRSVSLNIRTSQLQEVSGYFLLVQVKFFLNEIFERWNYGITGMFSAIVYKIYGQKEIFNGVEIAKMELR